MNTIDVTMAMPEIEGWEYTGEFRQVLEGENFLNSEDEVVPHVGGKTCHKYPILRRKLRRSPAGGTYHAIAGNDDGMLCGYGCDGNLACSGNYFPSEAEALARLDVILGGE